MANKFTLSEEALSDLRRVGRYTQKEYGVKRRKKYLAQLDKRFIQLSKSPHLGRERPEIKPGYKNVVEGKHVIFCRMKDINIEILRVLHGNMDIKRRIE